MASLPLLGFGEGWQRRFHTKTARDADEPQEQGGNFEFGGRQNGPVFKKQAEWAGARSL